MQPAVVLRSVSVAMVLAVGWLALSAASPAVRGTTPGPAAASLMVCANEAVVRISQALDTAPDPGRTHTWSDHLFTCRYRLSGGLLVLSVKELPDRSAAAGYLAARRAASPGARDLPGLGQQAVLLPDGSVLVRRDASVLFADVAGLPERVGGRRITRANAAISVAMLVLACWTEDGPG